MNFPWFRLAGIFYIPIRLSGWIILLAGAGYAVYSFIDIDSRSHSASDTLMNFAVRCIMIYAVYTLFAFLTSMKKQDE